MCSAYGNKGPAAGNILLYVADIADATGHLTARVNRDGLCGNRVPRYSVFLNLIKVIKPLVRLIFAYPFMCGITNGLIRKRSIMAAGISRLNMR